MAEAIYLNGNNGSGGGSTPDMSQYQKKLVAGDNILIDDETNTISATGGGAEYVAGEGISIDPETNTISAEKQLKYVNEADPYKAVIIGGEEAGNSYGDVGGTGIGCLVEGRNNNAALSTCVHVEGKDNYGTGMGSHTEGTNNFNYGNFSHVEGNGNYVYGKCMHVFGKNSTPSVHLGGDPGVKKTTDDPTPVDNYSDYVEIVGNGANGSVAGRGNARELRWNGKEWLADTLEVSRDPQTALEVATKQYVDNNAASLATLVVILGQRTAGTTNGSNAFGESLELSYIAPAENGITAAQAAALLAGDYGWIQAGDNKLAIVNVFTDSNSNSYVVAGSAEHVLLRIRIDGGTQAVHVWEVKAMVQDWIPA